MGLPMIPVMIRFAAPMHQLFCLTFSVCPSVCHSIAWCIHGHYIFISYQRVRLAARHTNAAVGCTYPCYYLVRTPCIGLHHFRFSFLFRLNPSFPVISMSPSVDSTKLPELECMRTQIGLALLQARNAGNVSLPWRSLAGVSRSQQRLFFSRILLSQ